MNTESIIKNIDIGNDEYIVVGVSAGPDSMALLDILQKKIKANIVCVHINHNIRTQSNEEEQYLKEYCKKNNLIFESYKIEKYQKKNFENEAREKRYKFYEEILQKYHSNCLFLAHHGDDLIETVLMKIIRGSNLEGYAGIKMYSKLDNYTIIRPLLTQTKEDILKYNKENNIKYYLDSTNTNQLYTRNRYRMNILPQLKKEDKSVHLKFLNYSNTLQEYYNYIEEETKKKINNNYINNKINIDIIKQEHPFMRKNIIFYILSNLYNNKANIIKNKHIEDIIKLIESKKQNSFINLPNNYIAKKEYKYIYIEKKKEIIKNYKIKLDDIVSIDKYTIKKIDNIETNGNDVCRLNSKEIKLPLYLRNKKNGDYISVLGLNGNKKVKDIFIDYKIPKDERLIYPLLVDSNDNILWIPNLKKSKYNVKKDEFYDIILTCHKEKEREEYNEKEEK